MVTPVLNKGTDWTYLLSLTINQQTENPVSCLRFDPCEELLWCGSSTGKVTSFSASNHYNRYSAFISNRFGPIHALEITEEVVYALSENCLRGTTRQGVPITKYASPSLTQAKAICRIPTTSTLIIGGEQQKLLQYDFNTEKEIRTSEIPEKGAVIVRYNGNNIFTADMTGYVNVRNPKTFETIQRLPCHGDRISDFDVQGSKLITCGYSQRLKSSHGDPFVKVFDLRMYKAIAPIPLAFSPKFIRFMPTYYDRIVVVSQSGGVRISDLNSNKVGTSLIVEANGLSAFDYSSSKHVLAFGDYAGGVSLYGDDEEPVINSNSYETVFAFPPVGPPVSFAIEDMMTPLAAVPMPFPEDETLLSDWPPELTQPMYRRFAPPVEHTDKKVMHYVTQVKNPRINTKLKFHNVVPYILEAEPVVVAVKPDLPSKRKSGKVKIQKLYRKCPQIQTPVPRRGVVEDVRESYSFNTTNNVVIESTYHMNVLINPIVQALYPIVSIRNLVYSHICTSETCIACQLRFLFSMMTDSEEQTPIVSTDLVRSLIACGLTVLKKDVLETSRNMCLMLLKTVSRVADYLDRSLQENILTEEEKTCLKTEYNLILRCVRCGAIQNSPKCSENAITLNYNNVGSQASFCQLIEKAFHLGNSSAPNEERECEECKTKSRMESKRRVKTLGSILLIDTNGTNEVFSEFWQRQLQTYESRPEKETNEDGDSPRESKMCRFGDDCRNKKTCKFSHGKIDWTEENQRLIEDGELDGWQHYIPKRIAAQLNDGIVRLSDISDIEEYDEPRSEIFELVSMVTTIGNGEYPVKWSHSVTMIKDDQKESLPWTLINEKLICRIHEHEVLHMDSRWKLPLFLAYKKKNYIYGEEKRTPIPESIFFSEQNLAPNTMTSSGNIEKVKLPGKGELVGIDAEFIKVKCGNLDNEKKGVISRAVGRVSCVDATGEHIIFDDHVQVTSSDEVADYLTQFSGIVSDDLDAKKSTKYLTTLKRVYLKILVLVQRGCIFVGHALNNDFTVLNIHVPSSQIIDTVNLLRLDSQRLLSLQFLAFQLLGDKIQEDSHDSVVDAQYALKIYRKYLELKEKDSLNIEMRRIYDIVPCGSPMKSVSPANSMTETK